MIANETIPAVLNEQQVMMLRLLRKPLPEEDFKKMQRLAVQLLSSQLDERIGNWEEEGNIVPDSNVLLVAIGNKSKYRPIWDAFVLGKYQLILSE